MCADNLSCLQSIELQLQVLTPPTTTAMVLVSSGTWADPALTAMAGTGTLQFALGLALGAVFIAGLSL